MSISIRNRAKLKSPGLYYNTRARGLRTAADSYALASQLEGVLLPVLSAELDHYFGSTIGDTLLQAYNSLRTGGLDRVAAISQAANEFVSGSAATVVKSVIKEVVKNVAPDDITGKMMEQAATSYLEMLSKWLVSQFDKLSPTSKRVVQLGATGASMFALKKMATNFRVPLPARFIGHRRRR